MLAARSSWQLTPGVELRLFDQLVTHGGWRWKIPARRQIWLWLNRSGSGLVWGGKGDRLPLKPGMYALTGGGQQADWLCLRYPGTHELCIVSLETTWLRCRLRRTQLHPDMQRWLDEDCPVSFCGLMGDWEHELCLALTRATQLAEPSAAFIAEARLLEWAAIRLFRPRQQGQVSLSPICSALRQPDAVHKALNYLSSHLSSPLNLTLLSRHAGMSPHHLSRKIRQHTGRTLQHHLRRLRVERACELLSTARCNVTEAAFEVGYQSLSHFAKAFRQETGMSPRQWLAQRNQSRA